MKHMYMLFLKQFILHYNRDNIHVNLQLILDISL